MSSFIVVEALGLVTFWGAGRIVRKAQRMFKSSKGPTATHGDTDTDDDGHGTDVRHAGLGHGAGSSDPDDAVHSA